MKTTEKITIFLPIALLRELLGVCNAEFRTRSEVIRLALRSYLDQRYVGVEPTKGELSHVRQTRSDFRRGSSESLKRFVGELQSSSVLSGAKKILKAAAIRTKEPPIGSGAGK